MKDEQNPHDEEAQQQEEYAKIKLIVFGVGLEEYALPITQLKEIVPAPHITAVPLTNGFMRGVANIRGSIIPIIDLAKKFGLDKDPKSNGFAMVVETNDYKIGFWVQEVPSIITVTENLIDEAPNLWQKDQKEQHFIKGIVKTNGRMIVLMDIFQFIEKEIEGNLILN